MQGGLQSLEEALFNHIPVVAIPIFGDQFNNADKMQSKGFGIAIDQYNLDENTFRRTILEVIQNPK